MARLVSGKYKAAERYLNLARSLAQKDLSKPDKYLSTLEDLGALHEARGRYWQAYRDYDEVLTARCKDTKGQSDEKLAKALDQTGRINYLLGNLTIARQQLTEATDMFGKLTGRSLAEGRALNDLSRINLDFDQIDAARSEAEHAFEINEKLAGPKSLEACQSLIRLSQCALSASRFEQAEKILSKAMLIATGTSREATLARAECLDNCAKIYLNEGRVNEALSVGQEALALREQLCGKEHPLTSESLTALAIVYLGEKDFASAAALLQRSLEITEDQFGLDSVRAAKLRLLQGTSASMQGSKEEAKLYFSKAREAVNKIADKDDPEAKRLMALNSSFTQATGGFWEDLKAKVGKSMGLKKDASRLTDPSSRSVQSLITQGAIKRLEEAPPPQATSDDSFKMGPSALWGLALIAIPIVVVLCFAGFSIALRSFSYSLTFDRHTARKQANLDDVAKPSDKAESTAPSKFISRFTDSDSSRKVNKFWEDLNQ
jgi:tetratricopeptide (TPR) repeat protein